MFNLFSRSQSHLAGFLGLMLLTSLCSQPAGQSSGGQILFLEFKCSVGVEGTPVFVLSHYQKKEGKLKRKRFHRRESKKVPSGYHWIQLDPQGKTLSMGKFKDPFQTSVEYFNEDGTMGRKKVASEEGVALLRFQLQPQAAKLEIRLDGELLTSLEVPLP